MKKKSKELTFEELVEYVKDPDLIDEDTAFRIFKFVADEEGNFKDNWKPGSDEGLFEKLLFDEDGNSHWYIKGYLGSYIDSNSNIKWNSDLVMLYHFRFMDSITKGNYSTYYAWR